MLSSLRVLAWRVVELGKRVLLDQSGRTVPPAKAVHKQQSVIYRYIQHQQAIKKCAPGGVKPRGRGGGLPTNGATSVAVAPGPLVGILGRLGPLVSGAVRRLSARRIRHSSLYRDTAPLFALVGVTLIGRHEEGEDGDNRGQVQGFVTKQEELEAICGSIRDAVCRSGWLYEPKAGTTTRGTGVNPDSSHVYSLEDLELAGVIDKGCNAAVYAARWRNGAVADPTTADVAPQHAPQPQHNAPIVLTDSSLEEVSSDSTTSSSYGVTIAGDHAAFSDVTSKMLSSSTSGNIHSSFLSTLSGTGRPQPEAGYGSETGLGLLAALPLQGSTASLCQAPSAGLGRQSGASSIFETRGAREARQHLHSSTLGDISKGGYRYSSLSTEVSLLLTSGGFGAPAMPPRRPQHKRVRFLPPSVQGSPCNGASTATGEGSLATTTEEAGTSSSQHPPPASQYPLAVKLVFNYEAASNAPAILSALYRELIPARSVQLDALYQSWREDFFGDTAHSLLPYHPNIVDMPCAFVDRVPLLQGGMQLYPTALPPRLNPQGCGRNMSLFCVMRRYDMPFDAYLQQYPSPSGRTSLLLLTQLLEGLQHLHAHNISHRDLKPDNILLSLRDGCETPWLVITDFGCCLAAASSAGLTVPFVSREAEPRQGNAALMAPEVKTARPGLLKSVDFSCCDLWAAGTLAYQCYGQANPFLREDRHVQPLDSGTYRESQLPGLQRSVAPPAVRRLVGDLLRRKPRSRPSPTVAATLCQLSLWGPRSWLNRRSLTKPKHDQVMEWLLCLTTKVLCERRGHGTGDTEYRMVSTFLARVHYTDVLQAISWNKAF